MSKQREIKWLEKVEVHDYEAAEDYLSLVCHPAEVKIAVESLKKSKIIYKKAKDIFRASRLPQLSEENFYVKKNLKKIDDEKELSPILLVVDRINRNLIIADGYHRACTCEIVSENTLVPCQIAYL